MANIAISALPAASTVASGDLTVIVQGGVTKRATVNQLPAGSGSLATGYIQLVNGQNYIDVVFASAQADTNWETQCSVVNTADTTPLNIWPGITTARTTTGFRLQLNGAPDTSNYYLQWAISPSLALPVSVPATALTLSGPSGGLVSVASTNFTVALSPVGGTVTGTITVTPSSGGGGGTFTPATVGLTTAAPSATFTYTPASTGAKTISVTNSGTLTNPSSLTYTVTNTATALTLSGPSSGLVSVASTNFTVALSPVGGTVTGTVTVTPNDSSGGGTFTPTSVGLTTGSPSATFTYTPGSTGAKTIGVTNTGTLTNPTSLTYTVTNPATALTLSGPSGGFVSVASTNFTVALSPVGSTVTGTVTVTPNDSSGGGTFTPTTVGLTTASPSGTFTYTPGSTGAKTIGVTNSGGLTNPGTLTYTVTTATPHLLNTLISYWKLDETGSPSSWVDTVGTNHLTSLSPPTPVTGKINNGVQSNGIDEYLSVASNSTLQVTSDFTFSMWVKMLAVAGDQHILTKNLSGTGNDYDMYFSSGGLGPVWYTGTIGAGSYAHAPSTMSNGVWAHIVAWFDSATGQVYVRVNDGTTYASTASPALVQTTGAFVLANQGSIFLNGVIDEVGFWKRVLTPVEITALYGGGAGLAYSSFTT